MKSFQTAMFSATICSVLAVFVGTQNATAQIMTSGTPERRVAPPTPSGGGGVNDCEDPITHQVLNCRGGSGCFSRTTAITMADSSTKPINEIKIGDAILNPVTKKASRVKNIVAGPETIGLIEIGYTDTVSADIGGGMLAMLTVPQRERSAKISVTQTHPMLTEGGIKQARAVALGDFVKGADGNFHQVSFLRRLPVSQAQFVYNIELDSESDSESEHFLLADGIVAGDLKLQKQYDSKSSTADALSP